MKITKLILAVSAFLMFQTGIWSESIWNFTGTKIDFPPADFSKLSDSWIISNTKKMEASVKDSVLTISCAGPESGKTSWYYYTDHKKSFSVNSGIYLRISFEARKLSGDGTFNLLLSGVKNGKKGKGELVRTETVDSADFKIYKTFFLTTKENDSYYLRFIGTKKGKYEIKNIVIDYVNCENLPAAVTKNESVFVNGKFNGPIEKPLEKKLGRGVSAVKIPESGVLVTWRFLESDDSSTCFTVTRVRDGNEKQLTKEPVTDSTNYKDSSGKAGDIYIVKAFKDSSLTEEKDSGKAAASGNPYRTLRAKKGNIVRGGVASGDLDGDGEYDYVIKTGADFNIDPSEGSGWKPSEKPFTLEAYTNDGKLLWTKNLGWNIESGIWYSPYVVADLDGDGKCEVIAKTGEYTDKGGKDYRGADRRVKSGPQYLSVFNGLTGEEIAKTDWVSWEAFENEKYENAVRNQLAIANLDGKTPCVVMLSGTYAHQEVHTFFLKNNELVPVWSYNNRFLGAEYQGQGAHWTLCVDIDDDKRDEVIIGSVALDDNGDILWTTGRGHPDSVYYGEIDPDHEGKEILYTYETAQKDGGFLLVEPRTGKEIWKFNEPTDHIHSQALCSDIDPSIPGREFYGMNSAPHHVKTDRKWYFAGNGKLLKSGNQIPEKWSWAPDVAYITDKPYSSLIKQEDFKKADKFRFEGTVIHIFDLDGDWREEVLTAKDNELRIYSTVDVSENRRPSLMQDDFYRSVVINNSSGYGQHPELPDGMKFN